MNFCRNVSVSGGMPSEYPPEQVVLSPPPCSNNNNKLGALTGSLDDLISGHNTEVDVSLEWLSIFVEDCFSSTGHLILPALPVAAAAAPPTNNVEKNKNTTTTPNHHHHHHHHHHHRSKRLHLQKYLPHQNQNQNQNQNPSSTCTSTSTPPNSLQNFVFPSKARSKRRRRATTTTTTTLVMNNNNKSSWAHQLNPQQKSQTALQLTTSDPPLLQQAYWLADSELILPPPPPKPIKEEDKCNNLLLPAAVVNCRGEKDDDDDDDDEHGGRKEEYFPFPFIEEDEEKEMIASMVDGSFNGGQARRCTHCLSQRTPQWRAGPLGPKTLCNACGVRYKSGRLLPEYRPAKSPTFVSYLHSNSHKKVLEMRMGGAALSPIATTPESDEQ